MSTVVVLLAYLAAIVLALVLLYVFRARRWYWHVISVLVALVIGLVPLPEPLQTPQGNLAVGVVFIFLFLWGIAAPFFRKRKAQAQQPGS